MQGDGKRIAVSLTVPDSSVNVSHVLYRALIEEDYGGDASVQRDPKRGKRAGKHLVPEMARGNVRIPETVLQETLRVSHGIASDLLRRSNAGPLKAYRVRQRLDRAMHEEIPMMCEDGRNLLRAVRRMYREIWTRPGHRGLKALWDRSSKGKKRPPGHNDMVILSTAAGPALRSHVQFLVADIDFAAFGGEIGRRFGIRVKALW